MNKKHKINGYVLIEDPEHPRAHNSGAHKGFVYEHIKLAEETIGRPLTETEVVHHLDSKRDNNHPSNLLVLDRGQHTKLHHWMDKNFIIPKPKMFQRKTINCLQCNEPILTTNSKFCSVTCKNIYQRKTERPNIDQLGKDITTMPMFKVGEKYGVSDNAIRKWCKSLGLPYKYHEIS